MNKNQRFKFQELLFCLCQSYITDALTYIINPPNACKFPTTSQR